VAVAVAEDILELVLMELLLLQLLLLLAATAVLEEAAEVAVETTVSLKVALAALAVSCYTGNKEKS
jgi:hypothetical protein